jgi:hypothetical protein
VGNDAGNCNSVLCRKDRLTDRGGPISFANWIILASRFSLTPSQNVLGWPWCLLCEHYQSFSDVVDLARCSVMRCMVHGLAKITWVGVLWGTAPLRGRVRTIFLVSALKPTDNAWLKRVIWCPMTSHDEQLVRKRPAGADRGNDQNLRTNRPRLT